MCNDPIFAMECLTDLYRNNLLKEKTLERVFIVTVIEARLGQIENQFIFSGSTLYQAILTELIKNAGCFMWWTPELLGENCSHEERAVECLRLLETGDCCDFNTVVSDITNYNDIKIIFPVDKRPKDFDPLIIGKKFYINCWIPVYSTPEERPSFSSIMEAEQELDQLRMMQPENIYSIEGE